MPEAGSFVKRAFLLNSPYNVSEKKFKSPIIPHQSQSIWLQVPSVIRLVFVCGKALRRSLLLLHCWPMILVYALMLGVHLLLSE